jgi:predicted esterase
MIEVMWSTLRIVIYNICSIAQVTTPLMMIHAEDDEIIPYDLGRKVS